MWKEGEEVGNKETPKEQQRKKNGHDEKG